jgi:hypothetical protein
MLMRRSHLSMAPELASERGHVNREHFVDAIRLAVQDAAATGRSRFDAQHFQDFLWRRFFARALPPEDFELVTQAA